MRISALIFILSTNSFAAKPSQRIPASENIQWAFTSTNSQTMAPANSPILNESSFIFQLYTHQLSDYTHTTFIGTVPRIELQLKSNMLVCFPGSSEAERRKEFSYLTSQYVQPSPQLVTRKEIAEKYLKKNPHGIYLKELIQDSKIKGLMGQSRSFGSKIDQILTAANSNMTSSVFDALGANVIQMISKGRADYTIEYAFILKDLKESKKIDDSIISVPILDADPYMTQYLACSKTPEGLAVIQRADKIIRENIHNPLYWENALNQLPTDQRAAFQKEIDRFIQERTKKAVIIK